MREEYECKPTLTIDEAIAEIKKSRGNAQAKRMAIYALDQLKKKQENNDKELLWD